MKHDDCPRIEYKTGWQIQTPKNGKKKNLYLSCCQEHFQFPRCVFDESVLKSIDVASAEIKIVWSVHRFPFQLHICYVSGEAGLCKWKDADMDVQYIWLGLTLGVLRGITNVGTVINWLVPCLLFFLLSLRSDTAGVKRCACAATHQNYTRVPCICMYLHTYTRAHTNSYTVIRAYPGRDSLWAIDFDLLESGNSHFIPVSGEICPLIWIQSFLGVAPGYCLRRSKAGSQEEQWGIFKSTTQED